MRRTYASVRATLRDDPVYIAKQMGHKDARFTLTVYTKRSSVGLSSTARIWLSSGERSRGPSFRALKRHYGHWRPGCRGSCLSELA